MLAGGTQMAAVLAFAQKLVFKKTQHWNNFLLQMIKLQTSKNLFMKFQIPAISVDPGMKNSKFSGLKAFSEGFAKEGVGAGGSIISSMLKTGNNSETFLSLAEKEYQRLFTWQ